VTIPSFVLVLAGVGACGLEVIGAASTDAAPSDRSDRSDRDESLDGAPADGARTGSNASDAGGGLDAAREADVDVTPLLALSMTAPPANVDLETEGTTAWIHWGRTTNDEDSLNEKAAAPGAIPTFTLSGSTDLRTYEDNITTFSWTNGSPVASEVGTKNGVYSKTNKPRFTLRRKVGTTSAMRMIVYAGVYKATGRFSASLGEGPAPVPVSMDLDDMNKGYGRFVVDYRAPDAESELVITWELTNAYDPNNSNVTLAAATLMPGD